MYQGILHVFLLYMQYNDFCIVLIVLNLAEL